MTVWEFIAISSYGIAMFGMGFMIGQTTKK